MEFASKNVAGAGLGLGIAGTALGLLNNGGLGGLFSATPNSVTGIADTVMNLGDHYVTQKEMGYIQQLNDERVKNAIITSEQNTEIKIADVYERIMTRVNADQREQNAWNTQQMVNNAQISAAIATNANSIAALQNTCSEITKTVIPITAVCPEPMPLKNSWTAPTT